MAQFGYNNIMKSKRTIILPIPSRPIVSALILFMVSFAVYLVSAKQVSAAACTAPSGRTQANLSTNSLTS